MSQIDLSPFMPGGFVHQWMELAREAHPDVVEKDPEATKLIGALLLEHVAKVFYNDFGSPPATLFLVLVAKPRSGKGSLLRLADAVARRLGINVTGDVTPEALAEELSEHWNTIQIWEDMGKSLTRRGKEYYSGLDKLLNNLYYLSPVTQRRKQAKSIYLRPRSYLFSFAWDTTPEEWGAVQEFLGGEMGFARRVLPIRMSDEELPYFEFKRPSAEEAEDAAKRLMAMELIAHKLKDACFLVDLSTLGRRDEEEGELERRIRRLEAERSEKSRISDYVKKLTALSIVDSMIRVREVGGRPEVEIDLSKAKEYRGHELLEAVELGEEERPRPVELEVYEVGPNDEREARMKALVIFEQLVRRRMTLLADEDVHRYAELTKELLKRRTVVSKRQWWFEVVKGKKKRVVDEVLATLEGLGIVNVRTVGKTVFIIDPSARICGNCGKFMTPLCKLNVDHEMVWQETLMEEAEECFEPL